MWVGSKMRPEEEIFPYWSNKGGPSFLAPKRAAELLLSAEESDVSGGSKKGKRGTDQLTFITGGGRFLLFWKVPDGPKREVEEC